MTNELIGLLADKATRLRIHSINSTAEAGSGHPTSCMSAADVVATLFFHVMRYDPQDAKHPNNDRFILSKGHAAPVLYAAWAEAGIIPVQQLLSLRRIDSDLEGHPTPRLKWVEVATGSLGQGLSAGVGMALNAKGLDKLDYRTYVLMGDGETAEGGVWEAAALAAYYQLDNLAAIVDVNRLGQSQATMHGADGQAYAKKFGGFGWQTVVIDGHNLEQILAAFEQAQSTKGRPTAIIALTKKGKGVSFLEDKDGWHGKPLKKGEEVEKALRELPLTGPPRAIEIAKPSPAANGKPGRKPVAAPEYKLGDAVATREAYGAALTKLGAANPAVVAMDGDTKNSTFAEKFMKAYPERYFEGFIAEQNLVGVAVGLSKCGKVPFASTFGAFFGRAMDHLRMGAISMANIKCVGSHCGVSIGEDGPSQMALEDLALFRAIPNAVVFYPSDAVSTERLVALAAEHEGMVYIRTSRPKNPVFYRNEESFQIGGSKTLRSSGNDRLAVVAAGVTVAEAMKACDLLSKEGVAIRVVDAYSVKPVDAKGLLAAAAQSNNTLVVVEEHYAEGGLGDAVLNAVANDGVRVFKMAVQEIPRSGKPEELLDRYGLSASCIVKKVKELI
ncbi:MAG: transketolase [Acidobacteria bacterium]|nr:transketolase [Acidobacteriota bacterium]MCI0721376.1 transketolase [Acidobacteriota bacterium]